MNLLDLSTVYYLFHVILLNAILYEPRLSKKKAWLLTALCMVPLAVYNAWFFVRFGNQLAGQFVFFNCTIPSLVFFMLMAKHRNSRLLFTFCLSDTISLEIVYVTRFIDDALGLPDFWVLFILRLIAWPVLELIIVKRLRKPYLELQNAVQKGWGGFAAITLLFYVILLLMASYPSVINDRPEYIPALLLVMVLMPLIYWCILRALFHQQELHRALQQEQLLQLQTAMLTQRMEQIDRADREIAIQRHDLRHRFATLDAMLARGDIGPARDYISDSSQQLAEARAERFCLHPVLDAVFSAYFRQARTAGIRVEANLDIPDKLPVDASELSAVFANALENAIHAVRALPAEQRLIRCKCVCRPQLIFRVSNPYTGPLTLDKDGIPTASDDAHGFGTRSIAAYCKKHGAACVYRAEDGWFSLELVQPIWLDAP